MFYNSGANAETTQIANNNTVQAISTAMSPQGMIMNTINYSDLPSSPEEGIAATNTLENSLMGINSGGHSPPMSAPMTSIPYTLTQLTLDTVSPIDPNLNNTSMNSPTLNGQMNCTSNNNSHSNRSSPMAAGVQMGEPFSLAQLPQRLKQEVI